MSELKSLYPYIREQHFDPEALRFHQDSLKAHPARLVVVKQFFRDDIAQQVSKFLLNEAEFQRVYGLYSREGASIDEKEWLDAGEEDRFFRFSKIAGVRPECSFSLGALTYLRLRKSLQDSAFTMFFEKLSGIRLRGSDTFAPHGMGAGDFLKRHNDKVGNRQLAVVLYLSPGWQPSYGGALILIDRQGREIKINPEFNSMAAFDVTAGTIHFIEPVAESAGSRRRVTISGWYNKYE